MNNNERWLELRLKAKPILDGQEQFFIDRIVDKNASEADRSSSIDALEVLFSIDALPNLLILMQDEASSYSLREQAANAIAIIGSAYIVTQLEALRGTASPNLSRLIDIASKSSA